MKLKALSGEILKSSKPSDGRAIYAMWAGYGADPILDPELFATLPPRVQREKWELRRIWDNNPELTAQEGLTLLRKKQENVVALPPVPDWFKYHFPEVPYAIFSLVGDGVDLTPQQLNLLETHIASDSLLEACRTEEGKLTTVKPLDGVFSYIWRHARLVSGTDSTIPITCLVDLADGFGKMGLPMSYSTAVFDLLVHRVDYVVENCGKDKLFSSERHAVMLGYIHADH